MKKKTILSLLLASLLIIGLSYASKAVISSAVEIVGEHLEYEYDLNIVDDYYRYSTLRADLADNSNLNIPAKLGGKEILIENSMDLYHWSLDLSFKNTNLSHAQKVSLAAQNYVLGQDIDYSERKSDRFFPIGYFIEYEKLEFTGTFDGRGFEIKNIYFVVFNEFYYLDSLEQTKVPTEFMSMFSYNSGTIKNLGLIDPIIDLENEHPELRHFSYLVGDNNGTVENVYVEDTRGILNGGLRAMASQVNIENIKNAAGIVHTNRNIFKDSYFRGESVVNAEYTQVFLEQPLVYSNTGSATQLVFTDYKTDSVNFGTKEDKDAFKISSAVLSDNWEFYPQDGYPKLYRLVKDGDGYYEINDALDLIYFSKLVKLRTVKDDPFNEEKYILTKNINFNNVAKSAYETPKAEFKGEFVGKVVNDKYPQINNFYLEKGVVDGENLFFGLFGEFSGIFENIVFYNATIKPLASQISDYTNNYFFVGTVAGRINNSQNNTKIKNVIIKGDIDLKDTNIGAFRVGMLAGEAMGEIEAILVDTGSNIIVDTQNYAGKTMKNTFYIGGVIGKTGDRKLTLYNALTKATITSLNATITTTSEALFYIGGVIGNVTNTAAVRHNIGFITNSGTITVPNVASAQNRRFYIGGIIGLSSGQLYDKTNIYGKWTNNGSIISTNLNATAANIAGVLNSDHSVDIEFVKIFGSGNLTLDKQVNNVSGLINHLTSSNLTISQAISSGNYTLGINKNVGVGVYLSNAAALLTLNYVEVYNNISYTGNTNTELSIAGVTLHEKAEFLNVVYGGAMNITITSGNQPFWVSGITKVLPSPYSIKNSINEGSMNINYTASGNMYVGGFVNRNLSGDLHNQNNAIRPKATTGIINSINMANIEILANTTGNMFVGGLVTLNGGATGGSIQDAVNTGDIIVRNSNNTSAVTATFSEDDNTGGLVLTYSGGIIVGGVTSTIVHGYARIFDTSNKGDIIGIAKAFVRSGGVLGSALYYEIQSDKSGINESYLSTSVTGNTYISNAVVANGINYGDVQAITSMIIEYITGATSSQESSDKGAVAQRPGIHSSAGGVIGYGLTKMKRMINHGNITATEVAGGVVGATMAYTSSGNTIIVDINTAINYGSIRASKTSRYTEIYNKKKADEDDFYLPTDYWITPNMNRDAMRRRPYQKRGFGGVFGRLQRARSQYMTAVGGSFDFVVNMDPNVDLIGRLDQVYDYTSSLKFFIFIDAKYYSAKPNDNTQTVFVGEYRSVSSLSTTFENAYVTETYTYKRSGFIIYTYKKDLTITINSGTRVDKIVYVLHQGNLTRNDTFLETRSTVTNYSYTKTDLDSNKSEYDNKPQPPGNQFYAVYPDNSYKAHPNPTASPVPSTSNPITRNVPKITENPAEASSSNLFVYDPNFEMRQDSTPLDNNEPITSYIYYAENDLLAPNFKTERQYGMYVLSSSSGSNYGAVLPKNFVVIKLRKISPDAPNDLDYTKVAEEYLIEDVQNSSYGVLFSTYESLYQTSYNDKSALLKEGQSIHIKDKNYNTEGFYESNTFTGQTITIKINHELINNNSNFEFDFEILKAVIPEGALIAKTGASQSELKAFRLNNLNSLVATGTLAPDLSYTVTNRTAIIGTTITLGTFTSYSDAAIKDSAFTNVYKTEYTLRLQIESATITNPTLYQVNKDGAGYGTTVTGTHAITNSIGLEFRENYNSNDDTNHKLKHGFVIDDFLDLYYTEGGNNVLVNKDYYEIVSVPKSARTFHTVVYLKEELRNGTYQIRYKFYQNDTLKNLNLNFTLTRPDDILEFVPYTSTNYDGSIANYDFDYDLFGIHTPDNVLMKRTVNTAGIPVYLAGYYVYEVYFLERFVKTDFFEFDSITKSSALTADGYWRHTINFRLGSTTVKTKYIDERKLSPYYYKDSNSIPSAYDASVGIDAATTTATREADYTIFTLDYKLPLDFYDVNKFTITYSYAGGSQTAVTANSNLIYFNADNRLNILMTKDALPGVYQILVKYTRSSNVLNAGKLTITKLSGQSGYLKNIKFSKFVIGTEYPDVYVVDSGNQNINSNYELGVYYNGINYNDADIKGEKYFRIDGEVARIPLTDYMPVNLVQNLPDGAMIKRKIYTSETTFVWSALVGPDSTESEIQDALATNYTVDPKTGEFSEDLVYIEYMIVPESEKNKPVNQQDGVTYYISVVDRTFTFLAVFNFWYKDQNNNVTRLMDEEDFDETMVFLSIYNYLLAFDGEEINDNEIIEDFSTIEFDEIIEIKSRMHMFYYIESDTKDDYIYQVGSNYSGYYRFVLELPDGYVYSIYVKDYDDEGNLLPEFSEYMDNLEGFFYYINTSSTTRTRYFHVVVEEGTTENMDWGLTDKYNTWD